MARLKLFLRIGGTLCFLTGIMCLPVGYGVSPKRDLSAFKNLADMHAFVRVGVFLMALGGVAVGASYLTPGRIDDEG